MIGAAPPEGNAEAGALPTEAMGLAPFTGGNAGSLAVAREPVTGGNAGSFAGAATWPGNGAGNAPCATAEPADAESTARVSGTIKRLIIKAVFSGKVQRSAGVLHQAILRFLPSVNNPQN